MEEETYKYFNEIEKFGGVIPAINAGFFQREIADAAYEYQKKIEEEKKIIVGVNKFQEEEERLEIELLKIDPEVEREQIKRLARLKSERNNDLVKKDLEELKEAARETKNLVPLVLQAARDYVTEGEIISAFKEVFGEYKETPIF
ncbi:Methylmalonyl-CoA mutase [subsurface metagenome]